MPLDEYRRKRDFSHTPEPSGDGPAAGSTADEGLWARLAAGPRFCVQLHRATRLHYDFRLEHGGVLLSWAIPRGPSLDPASRRLAVQTEDHPLDYGDFEGVIPSGYGMGTVELWDAGTFEWVRESAADPDRQIAKGDIKFRLAGQKLSGEFALVRIGERGRRYGGSGEADRNYLLIKKRDEVSMAGWDAADHDGSVKSGRSLDEIAAAEGGDPREARRQRTARERMQAQSPAQTRDGASRSSGGVAPSRGRPAPGGPGSPPAALPSRLPLPMLATPVDRPFSRPGWLFELKYDGVRAIVAVAGEAVRVVGRHGRDETARYPEAQAIPTQLRAESAILDCEIVAFDERGRPDFERLQSRINVDGRAEVGRAAERATVTFVAFDLLALDGRDLTRTSLRIRKKTLAEIVGPPGPLLYADHLETDGEALFEALREQGLEGMVGKRADSVYQAGRRSADWLKVKAWRTQTCAIAGWTQGHGRRGHLGALVLAVRRSGPEAAPQPHWDHAGEVGTGFSDSSITDLLRRMEPFRRPTPVFQPAPKLAEPVTWVEPELVCEVRHAGWTRAGALRHPAFLGLRSDLGPEDCIPEEAADVEAALPASEPGDRQVPRHGSDPEGAEGAVRASGQGAARGEAGQSAAPSSAGPAGLSSAAGGPGRKAGPGAARRKTGPSPSMAPGLELPPEVAEALEALPRLRPDDWWRIGSRRLRLTHLDKPLWPTPVITKRQMIDYYVRISPLLIPYLRDRPLSTQVFPDGITGHSFWRKDKPAHAPDWIDSWVFPGEGGTKSWIVVREPATLAWVANAGVIDLHPWHSRIDAPEQPDWAVFDLDPFEPATFDDVRDIARLVKAALDHLGLRGLLKTSGQTGLQIYVPVRRGPDYDQVRGWVEEVARAIGKVEPDRISWEWTVSRRAGKIRIDYTQNIINKTLAAPYSLRPAPGAPVSTPLHWEELDDRRIRPDGWTIATIWDRLAEVGDLFSGVLLGDQDLPG
ncbi:MAG TPA: non-homologous end-joining DNA ligase [Candidatus Binatia bacterium]|nr:non-homologous end-joining DNA ligase [Candidatus Binatia bacterium]